MDNDYYIELPNQLFYGLDNDKDSIFKRVKIKSKNKKNTYFNSYYILLVLDYLYTNTNRKGETIFSIEDIIKFCGLSRKQNKLIREILLGLKSICIEENKPILEDIIQETKIDDEANMCKANTLIHCKLNLFKYKEDGSKKWFNLLYYSVKDKILNYKIQNIDNVALLFYYCYINSRITKKKKGKNLNKDGGKPEVAYPAYKTIRDDLGLTDDTINKYNMILQDELHLILIGNPGHYQFESDKCKVTRESVNIYAIIENDDIKAAQSNLKEGIKYWKQLEINNGKIWLDTRYYWNNNRKLNGELGSLIKKENNRPLTEDESIRKQEIVEAVSKNEEQFKLQSLLDKNEGKILSNIYEDLNFKKSEYFAELENKLGLIDDNGELLVDWDYYKWIMVNYSKDKHDFYINCVAKYKREKFNYNVIHLGKSKPEDNYWEEEPDFDNFHEEQEEARAEWKQMNESSQYYEDIDFDAENF